MRNSFFIVLLFCSCTYNELVPVCEPDEQVFSNSVKEIIEEKCMVCHNSTPPILSTYLDVINAINNYGLRNEVVSLQMPPLGSPPLTNEELYDITSWIDCE